MNSESFVIALCIFFSTLQLSVAGPKHHENYDSQSYSRPKPVDESNHILRCPDDFLKEGKKCYKQLYISPEIVCPHGYKLTNKKECLKLLSKILKCPKDFVFYQGLCLKSNEVKPEFKCPGDFAFAADGQQCIHTVELEPLFYCPDDTIRQENVCIKTLLGDWDYLCPPNYILKEGQCYFEEIYDCTPYESNSINLNQPSKYYAQPLRLLGHSVKQESIFGQTHYSQSYSSKSHNPPTKITNKIVETKCKRILHEKARKLCAKGSHLLGKDCVREEQFPLLIKPKRFREEFAPLIRDCPLNYHLNSFGQCVIKIEAEPDLVCPVDTEPFENKCATYQKPAFLCPEDSSLKDNMCVKEVFTSPITEYTIKYACKGKDCAM